MLVEVEASSGRGHALLSARHPGCLSEPQPRAGLVRGTVVAALQAWRARVDRHGVWFGAGPWDSDSVTSFTEPPASEAWPVHLHISLPASGHLICAWKAPELFQLNLPLPLEQFYGSGSRLLLFSMRTC